VFSYSSQSKSRRFRRRLLCTAGLSAALFCLSATASVAAGDTPPATCAGQTFTQPFAGLADLNYYTLVPGGEFSGPQEGWQLSRGAQISSATRPDGTTGGVLDLPSGAEAISPPVCVTLHYPTARVWALDAEGSGGVAVSVAYAGSRTESKAKTVAQLHGEGGSWTSSGAFNVQPQIAGHEEGTREVRFIFLAGGKSSDTQLFGLYVDPRMR
jgi:hypothetical protein